ncbi:MAG: ribonucleoside-diphosphate reductase, partial [Candidatus Omnitrophica bacterium]|nr:ribonucleoside-diphosphate reductase [Candidatus Omnitrophota bacterium]
ALGTPQRERSVKQLVSRVADTITGWGIKDGYFATTQDAETFRDELTYLLVHQYAAFNSPVWFNVGIEKERAPQCSACFILSVEDSMDSILEWYRNEGMIFKYGSGSGLNVSPIRSAREKLAGGGTASGPVSFMRAADASAGVIKSGGKTRRAAKMVVMNADHPDVKPFILCKWKEEEKAHKLIDIGYDASIDGEAYSSIFFQNANNSVRVTDEFMKRALDDEEWELRAVTTGEILERVRARDLLRLIAEATWHCGDPGMQFNTTINDWHTCPNTGRINASNPCFAGDALVYTDKGLIPFKELYERAQLGEPFRVFTHDATNPDKPTATVTVARPTQIMCTGVNEVYQLRFSNGVELKATANHRFFTKNRGMVAAKDLQPDDEVMLLDQPVELLSSSLGIDLDNGAIFESGWGGRDTKEYQPVELPRVWTSRLADYVGYLVGDGSLVEASDANNRLSTASVVFGDEQETNELLPHFEELFTEMGVTKTQTVKMPNGTVQFRVNRTP